MQNRLAPKGQIIYKFALLKRLNKWGRGGEEVILFKLLGDPFPLRFPFPFPRRARSFLL